MSSTPQCPEHHDLCECAACICLSPPPGQEGLGARLVASAEVDQVVDTPKLPIEVPESDTLWRLMTGSSLNTVRHGLASGSPFLQEEAKSLRRGAQRVWAQIRAEVGA